MNLAKECDHLEALVLELGAVVEALGSVSLEGSKEERAESTTASWLAVVVTRSSLLGENAGSSMAAQTDRWKSTHLFCLPENPLILTSGVLAGVAAARLRRAEATAAATLSSKSGCWCVDTDKWTVEEELEVGQRLRPSCEAGHYLVGDQCELDLVLRGSPKNRQRLRPPCSIQHN